MNSPPWGRRDEGNRPCPQKGQRLDELASLGKARRRARLRAGLQGILVVLRRLVAC